MAISSAVPVRLVPRLRFRMKWGSRHVVGISRQRNGMPGFVWCGTGGRQVEGLLRQWHIAGDLVPVASAGTGDDQGSDVAYVSVRRLAIFIETSLYAGTSWVVFEPNTAALWGRIRLAVGAFMQGLFMQGDLQGQTADQAYFVKCDSENNPQVSIDEGVVNILVGFAPVYPAEFVVISIQQLCQG